MSLKDWIGRRFGLTDAAPWALFYGGASHSGKAVTIDSAMQLSTFWACTRLTAGAIASMPLQLFEKDGHGGRHAADHDLVELLTVSPDGEKTAFEFWEAATAWLLVSGNAYAEISRIGGRIVALNLLPSDQVQVTRNSGGDLIYKFTQDGQHYELPAESVLHLRGFGFGGDLGLSVIRYGVQTFGSAIAAEETAGKILGNGMMPSGVLSSENELTDEQRVQLTKIMQAYSSSTNAGKMMVLESGLKFDQLSMNAQDGQLLQTRSFSVEDICRWFGAPPVVVGHAANGVTAWGSGIEALLLQWLTTGLNPIAKRIEDRLRFQLLAPGERRKFYPEFNREALLQADSDAKMKFLSGAVQNGLMTRAEGRQKLNLPDRPEADFLTAQTNLAPLDKLGGADPASAIRNALGLTDAQD
jgi:HK97 family phage portal protein